VVVVVVVVVAASAPQGSYQLVDPYPQKASTW